MELKNKKTALNNAAVYRENIGGIISRLIFLQVSNSARALRQDSAGLAKLDNG